MKHGGQSLAVLARVINGISVVESIDGHDVQDYPGLVARKAQRRFSPPKPAAQSEYQVNDDFDLSNIELNFN
jgi:hypothetical protein